MSIQQTDEGEPRRPDSTARLNWFLVVIALVLAFGLGRLWGHHGEPKGPAIEPDEPGTPQEESAKSRLDDLAKDNEWSSEDSVEFAKALAPLGKEGRHRMLDLLANRVNSQKLKIPVTTAMPPGCVTTCPSPPSTPGGNMGASKPPERTLKQ